MRLDEVEHSALKRLDGIPSAMRLDEVEPSALKRLDGNPSTMRLDAWRVKATGCWRSKATRGRIPEVNPPFPPKAVDPVFEIPRPGVFFAS